VVEISATNIVGTSPYSVPNTSGATVETAPSAPTSSPTALNSSESTATVSMSPTVRLLQSSGSQILYYELDWDQGTNGVNWTSYTVTSNNVVTVVGLTSGQQYEFRYRT
jgi:hypothetical protein